MHQDLNLLVLDEPTNHLDIDSREVLEEALEEFNGTILAVSHDRYFLNKLFQKTYWIHEGRLYFFEGPYTWAKEKLQEQIPVERPLEKKGAVTKPREKEKKMATTDTIEAELEALETEIALIEDRLQAEEDLGVLQELHEELERLEEQRELKYIQYEEQLS